MSGYKIWGIGEVVEAGDFQSYIQNQTVMKFADSGARSAALGTGVTEGMIAYLANTNSVEYYSGSGWVAIASSGDITGVTAGTALTGGGTSGDVTLSVNLNAITIPPSQITGVTATASELNVLDGITATTTELNYVDGVTSNIQAQINALSGGGGDISSVTAGTALTGGGTSGDVTLNVNLSAITIPPSQITGVTATASELNVLDGITATTTELNYTDGVTSAIQTQLNSKVSTTDGTVSTASTSSTVVRNITLSTSDPSGGSDGDVWLVYTA